jgi:type I restriction-modification system DNA methylase subunit
VGVLELRDITESDILSLASAEDVVRFFAKLGYNTNARTKQTPANINITGDEITRQISSVELVADQEGLLQVYLFELRSVTVAATQTIARALRNLPVNILMILTASDYERIDFVLLEKLAPKEGKKGPTAKQVGVVPRVLSVKRRSPDRKEMRLLRRLQYTEQDPWAQYAKLVSAFSMIGWTEEFYINRALFSDYVLNNRLRNTPDWQDNPSAVFKEFTKICYKAGTYHSEKKDSEFFMNKFVEPALEALGFHLKQNGARHDKKEKMVEEPDLGLYLSEKKDKAVGGLCAYPWDRSLDNIDDVRDPERGARIPGQYVVRLLEKGNLPWIVVTNGKFWRLYTEKTHSKATEFYEVDLEEILAMEDPQEAFRYFWLLFRAEAFRPKPHSIEGETKEVCLLDYLLLESETYARELGEKLKDNVFKNIFPKLAKGFIVRMGGPGKYLTMSEKERDEELSQVFRGTLTFLYRVLFLNFAESRDLLPVREVRGYWEVSLQKMKDEIAKKSGKTRDKVAENIKKGYDASRTTLYDRLTELFEIVDKGAPRLNMPTYNGGLFFTDPSTTDESMEAANARFLKLNKIPDRFLAEGIDLMARELDEKTTRLEFIDYKSLGVRQLGSIYEGLLEFNIQVAPEDMAVVKGKKAEKVVPLAEAKKPKNVIKKGEVYLENNRHERKVTGSYYTPDYIVKYIVENVVGPVLAEKMVKLKPKLRSHMPEPTLVDELFEVRVLDPAMGSGHFLVEAVDLITDRLVDYLSRFPNNPVQMEIERTRQEILSEMDKRGIVVDPARLTDLNLLRRFVLKRCIYGVDLNPMAVELAKVSLWLHCFTLGAPLSFLDHHLKCGNSLIGAKVDEVAKAIEGGQMTLFSTSRFGGVNKATDMMLKIGELSDVTPEQVKKSRESYQKALSTIEPYKSMLDVYTSRWFGNEPHTEGRGKTKKNVDMALVFLKSDESEKWLKDPENLKGVKPEYQEVVETALAATKNPDWRFFHWELEFPEVWYAMGKRKENPGFDAVVGNPPYVRVQGIGELCKPFLGDNNNYFSTAGSYDLYVPFTEKGSRLTSSSGRFCFIIPNKFILVDYGEKIRELTSSKGIVERIVNFADNQIFEGQTTYTCLFFLSRRHEEFTYYEIPPLKDVHSELPEILDDLDNHSKADNIEVQTSDISGEPWHFFVGDTGGVFQRMDNMPIGFKEIIERDFQGIPTGMDKVFILESTTNQTSVKGDKVDLYSRSLSTVVHLERSLTRPLFKGVEIERYNIAQYTNYIIFPYEPSDGKFSLISPKVMENKYPATWGYLKKHEKELRKREKGRFDNSEWYGYSRPQNLGLFEKPKILTQVLSDEPAFSLDDKGQYFFVGGGTAGAHGITIRESCKMNNHYLLSILNSHLLDIFFDRISTIFEGGFRAYTGGFTGDLIVRLIHFTTPKSECDRLVSELKKLYLNGRRDKSLNVIRELLPKDTDGNFLAFKNGSGWVYDLKKKEGKGTCPEKSDVVHDFLAFLAEQMIDLNKQKQAEQKRFLGWLEGRLGIVPKDDKVGLEVLSGKTTIKGYLGDYQKGEEETPFNMILDVLHRNKNKIGANLSDPRFINNLKTGYEKSLETLHPMKEKLKKTDWLIDQVVYRLYGLTEHEIAIVEGRNE